MGTWGLPPAVPERLLVLGFFPADDDGVHAGAARATWLLEHQHNNILGADSAQSRSNQSLADEPRPKRGSSLQKPSADGTAGDNGTAGGALNQPSLGFLVG